LRRSVPKTTRVLLVESGSRLVIEKALGPLQHMFGEEVELDLVTCYDGEPKKFRGRAYNVNDYGGGVGRENLWRELALRGYNVVGIVCSGEPVMTKWKWWLAWRIPAKVFIINENADFFWFDRSQWRLILEVVLLRAGLTGAAAVPTLARLLFFPVTLTYLLLYAAVVHLRRRLRML
jgi:hypothetical protein